MRSLWPKGPEQSHIPSLPVGSITSLGIGRNHVPCSAQGLSSAATAQAPSFDLDLEKLACLALPYRALLTSEYLGAMPDWIPTHCILRLRTLD